MIEYTKYFSAIYGILRKYASEDNVEMLDRLDTFYSNLTFNEQMIKKHLSDRDENTLNDRLFFKKLDLSSMETMADQDNKKVAKIVSALYKKMESDVVPKTLAEHNCADSCCGNKSMMTKKMTKMMKNKGMKKRMEKELGKQFGMKDFDLESMLNSDFAKNSKQGQMISKLMNNSKIKNITKKFLTKENIKKFSDKVKEITQDPDFVEELNKIKTIFSEEKVERISKFAFETIGNMTSLPDMKQVEELISSNSDLLELFNDLQKARDDGLIDETKIMGMVMKYKDEMLKEFNIDTKTINQLTSMANVSGLFNIYTSGDDKKKLTQEQRRAKSKKDYRRKKRRELKNKKNKKKNGNRKKR